MRTPVIVSAKRTPFGRFLGALKELTAVELACAASKPLLDGIDVSLIDQVIVGNVISAGQGMNIARQISVRAGLPVSVPAYSVNMMCGSGLKSIALAAQAIRSGDANAVLCGGTESMSTAPHLLQRARAGLRFGDVSVADSILRDGLVDSFDQRHMGQTVEVLAAQYQISREAQDRFSVRSQQRFEEARVQGGFKDELVSMVSLDRDEHPRANATIDGLLQLKPAFDLNGTITAGNASGINDGAAMVVVAERDFARSHRWPVLASFDCYSECGCEPNLMGLGPVHAIRKLLDREDKSLSNFDTIEINEAFAAQTLACVKELSIDEERLNRDGGAIAVGHPIGTSGARLIVHLAHRISRGLSSNAMAALCVGGGQGVAATLSAPD